MMSKYIGRMITLWIILSLVSCMSNSQHYVTEAAQEFMDALKEQDMARMRLFYPSIDNIDIFYASDTSFVNKVTSLRNGIYRVDVTNYYLNDDKKIENKPVTLFFEFNHKKKRPTSKDYQIYDSYGLCSWQSYPHFKFALHTGCLKADDVLTDQEAIHRLRVAKDLLFYFSKLMYQDLEENVRITQTTITNQKGRIAYGKALVENRSDYTLPDLKYIIVYYDRANQIIGEDKGWVTQNPLEAGQTVAFDFVSSYDQLASNADFKIDFDLDLILQFVMDDDAYSGTEYEDFVNKKMIDI